VLRLSTVWRPTIQGEKVGTFFEDGGGWHSGCDVPGLDGGRIPGGELYDVPSPSLWFFLEMMALRTSCFLCNLLFACSSMFVSYFQHL
jgi:hypothetical protein